MSRTTVRRCLTTAVAIPVALAAAIVAAPVAVADPTALVPVATFTGGYTTDCDLPVEPTTGTQVSGAYDCSHTAEAIPVTGNTMGCGFVATGGPAVITSETCEARLLSGHTSGHADAIGSGLGYRCANGAGTGLFEYVPESGGPGRQFFVWLEVIGEVIHINGSYIDAEYGFIVVRATMPARCAEFASSPEGFNGTVTPV